MKRIRLLLCALFPGILLAATPAVKPIADGEGSIGTSTNAWGAGYFKTAVYVNGAALGAGGGASESSTNYFRDAVNLTNLVAAGIVTSGQLNFINKNGDTATSTAFVFKGMTNNMNGDVEYSRVTVQGGDVLAASGSDRGGAVAIAGGNGAHGGDVYVAGGLGNGDGGDYRGGNVFISGGTNYSGNRNGSVFMSSRGINDLLISNGVHVLTSINGNGSGLTNVQSAATVTGVQSQIVASVTGYTNATATWDDTWKTLSLAMIDGTTLQLGQEQIVVVRNTSGYTITNGTVCKIINGAGIYSGVALADASDTWQGSLALMGVATQNITNNTIGKVTTLGNVNDLDTTAFEEGSNLWLSATVLGGLTMTEPTDTTKHQPLIGVCLRKNANDGRILVYVQKTPYADDIGGMMKTGGVFTGPVYANGIGITNLPLNSGFPKDEALVTTSLSFTNATRTLHIVANGLVRYTTTNQYWWSHSTNQATTIPDVEGLHYVYYRANDGVLTNTQTAWTILGGEAQVAQLYWDATNNQLLYLGDERHNNDTTDTDHVDHHVLEGARWWSGGELIHNALATGVPSTSGSNTVVAIQPCSIWDDDHVNTSTGLGNQVSIAYTNDGAIFNIMYATGTTASVAWRTNGLTLWPFMLTPDGSRPMYNALSGGVWTTNAVPEDNYWISWIVQVPAYGGAGMFLIPDSYVSSSLTGVQARTYLDILANRNVNITSEMKPLYRLIFQKNETAPTAFSSLVKYTKLVSVQDLRIGNQNPAVSVGGSQIDTSVFALTDASRPFTGEIQAQGGINLAGTSITNGTNISISGRIEMSAFGPLGTSAVRAAQNNTGSSGNTTSTYILAQYDGTLSNAFVIDPETLTATNGILKVADRIENNFMLLSFDYITRMGITEFGMADGRVDTFRNQSGINTNAGKSTNQVYTGTPDFTYANTVTNTVATGTPYSVSYTSGGTNWTALIFSNSATFVALSTLTNVEVFILGGGGGGGGNIGGGGGAGGYRYISTNIFAGNYTVTVGAGGGAGAGTSIGDIANFRGTNGQNSVFDTWTASGGGGGGCNLNTGNPLTNSYGLDGGCGGGAGALIDVATNLLLGGNGNIPSVSPSQGFGGGLTTNSASASAGGGGCGTVGSNCTTDATAARGGEGTSNFITGAWVTYGGGGGGSYISGAGAFGGSGGGGQGGSGAAGIGVSGTDGLGGGGGGGAGGAGGSYYGGKGGMGGKGIVIVRYNSGVSSSGTNMTLITTNYVTSFVPKSLRATMWQKPILGVCTQNVDFILSASRDNGTTYTQLVLSAADSYYASSSAARMYAATVSLTNTPSGSNVVLKLTTSKQTQKIYGLGWTVGQ